MVVYTEYCQKKPQKNYPVLKSNKCRHELERDSVLKSQTCSQKTRYYQVSTAVFTDHLWTNHPRWMLLPGVNRPNIQEKALTQHINMVRQMKGTHMSWRGQQQAKTQWSQSKQTGARRLREIGKRDRVREWRMKLMYTNQRKLQIKQISRQSCHSLPDDLAFLMPKTNWSCDL